MKTLSSIAAVGLIAVASQAEARTEQCQQTNESEIAALFDGWNAALATGQPARVVERYAENSILLPTVSNTPRLTPAARLDYFEMFLKGKPQGVIDSRHIQIACNTAIDAGIYTFQFADGKKVQARFTYTYGWNGECWLITSHHSSAMPETTNP
jgi:uncharacterized protein (TIGR02246 family)